MENIQKDNKLCTICGTKAVNLCFKCSMILCDKCFKFIHENNLNKDHIKEKIDYFMPIYIKCPFHPKDRINLYCSDEKGKLSFLTLFNLFNI